MKNQNTSERRPKKLSLKGVLCRNSLIAIIFWTLILFAFTIRSIDTLKRTTYQFINKEAETSLRLDETFRKWTSLHGGFYVPVDSLTRPSKYLNYLKKREIITSTGDTLTLINPTRALRMMNEYYKQEYGVSGHITSLKPVNPENTPDEWEKKALFSFEKGADQVEQITNFNGKPVYRLMKPLYIQRDCLKCHSEQGYKKGDVRGGISITVPVADFILQEKQIKRNKIIAYFFVWLMGIVGIIISSKKIHNRNVEIDNTYNKLQLLNEQLEHRVKERTEELETINTRLTREIDVRKKAETVLKINEERYKGVIMSTASCIAVYEPVDEGENFKFIEFNPMAEKAENISRNQVIGKLVTEVFPGVVDFGLFEVFKEVYKTGKPRHFPIGIYHDKRINGYRENYVYKLSSGEIVAVYQDVTERKRHELAQEIVYNISNAATSTDSIKDLIARIQQEIGKVLDSSNFYVAFYDEKTDTLSMPYYYDEKDSFSDSSAKNTLSKLVIDSGKSLLATNKIKEKLQQEGKFVRKGSRSKVWLGVPLKIEKTVIGVLAIQNYEDEDAYSMEDVKMLEFIAGQISILIQRKKKEEELRAALNKAEESDRLKSAFLANMSHEIRTPMNGILGFASLLNEPDLTGEEMKKYTDVIQISGERMLNIINNLIDISKNRSRSDESLHLFLQR